MPKKIETVNDIIQSPNWREKWVEMVEKDSLGRRMLLGFKRRNAKRSRKGREVFLCPVPVMLDEIAAEYEKLKREIEASAGANSNGGADEHAGAAAATTRENDLAPGA